jgi:hypothetical protein
LDPILIESHRIDALRQKAAAIGVDEPEYAVALADSEESTRPETAVGDSAPSRFWYLNLHHRNQVKDRIVM